MGNKIKEFCSHNIFNILFSCLMILSVYGIKLFNLVLSIDNEAAISVPESLYSAWLSMGRWGLVAIKRITGFDFYNPFLSTFFFIFLIGLSVILWGMLFSKYIDNPNFKKFYWIFPVILFTSPIMAEQFGFLMQAFEVLFAFDLLAIAIYFIYKFFLEKRNYLYLVVNVVLVAFSFSVYQALTTVYVTAMICIFILILDLNKKKWHFKNSDLWKMILIFMVLFFVGYLINLLITQLSFNIFDIQATDYTDGQIQWGKASFLTCLKNVLFFIVSVIRGDTIFYSFSYLIVLILVLFDLFQNIKTFKGQYVLYFLSRFALLITPFLMGLILGANPSKRVVLSLPFMLAFTLMYLLCHKSNDKKALKVCYVLISTLIGFSQIQTSARLYYTEFVTNKEQERIAANIADQIYEITGTYNPEEPVIFIGSLNLNRNNSCYQSGDLELVGRSFFEVSFSPSHGTYLMQNYLRTLGINYVYPSEEIISEVLNYQNNMPIWPNENSIQNVNGVIVVKLS